MNAYERLGYQAVTGRVKGASAPPKLGSPPSPGRIHTSISYVPPTVRSGMNDVIHATMKEYITSFGLRKDNVMALHAHSVHAQQGFINFVDYLKGNLQSSCVAFIQLHLTQLLAQVLSHSDIGDSVLRSDFAGVSNLRCTAHLRWHDCV